MRTTKPLQAALLAALLLLAACSGGLKKADDSSGGDTFGFTDDTASTDTGSTDTGSTDTGSTDTGSTDTGSTDTGSTDGSTDTGSTDTGSTGTGLDKGLLREEDVSDRFTLTLDTHAKWDATICKTERLPVDPVETVEATLESKGELRWRVHDQLGRFGDEAAATKVFAEIGPGLERCQASSANTDGITVDRSQLSGVGDEAERIQLGGSGDKSELVIARQGRWSWCWAGSPRRPTATRPCPTTSSGRRRTGWTPWADRLSIPDR